MTRKQRPKTVHTIKSLMARTVEEGDCLLWTGYCGNGVPTVSHDGVLYAVRKLIYILQGKEIKPKMWYAARCGCTSCVNPDHIVVHSTRQHMAKMGRKAKNNALRAAKVQIYKRSVSVIRTQERADAIRLSNKTSRQLAAEYGVSRSTISNIKSGRSWVNRVSPFSGLFK